MVSIPNPLPFLKKGLKTTGKAALITTAAVAGMAALGYIASSTRKAREYKEPPELPPLEDPYAGISQIPSTYMPAMPEPELPQPQGQTLMGMPMVEGAHAQRIIAARQGRAAGVNAAAPDVPDVDGRPVQDMGAFRG